MPIIEISKQAIVFDPIVQTFCNSDKFLCPNYNHSHACPPNAPYLEEEILDYDKFFLVYYKFDLKNREDSKKELEIDSINKSKKKKKKDINSFIRNQIEKQVESFVKHNTSKYNEIRILWDGHCRICSKENKKCTFDEKIPCRFPNKIKFSMEAVGIHVTKTVENVNLDIEWPPENHVFRFGLICVKEF